ncbi:hypothetical protein CHLRE_06g287450v5 [Chlamydomonas reinhardtii]|uniref:cyclin-dependent kinase n=1 Tax=Chlamydomonas reinhardtii TaxID=3055 RepID=A0A2K3DQ22_CHLRE|nr:uncharacterized protein CHLRE_06g287450v5 [Chlamydomonas reinhardtii]PNW82642.1 hypothetical protein CHLRE_06g287450v5 [Chlamydomonas reinhardtii]
MQAATDSCLPPDQRSYEFVQELDEGSYGCVFACVQRPSGRLVAVKVCKHTEDPVVRRLLLREVGVLRSLPRHPCVVELLDAFRSRSSGRPHLVFECMERSAQQELEALDETRMCPVQLKLVAWQVVMGLAHCHRNNVIHRDLKPGNILLAGRGAACNAKLCDFGFARNMLSGRPDMQERLSSYVVTRWYRAPEILVGDKYGMASDVWALGCTLAELANGGLPLLPGTSSLDQLARIMRCCGPLPPCQALCLHANRRLAPLRKPPPRSRTVAERLPGVDPALVALVTACLQTDPALRPTARRLLSHSYFADVPHLLRGSPLLSELLAAAAELQPAAAATLGSQLAAPVVAAAGMQPTPSQQLRELQQWASQRRLLAVTATAAAEATVTAMSQVLVRPQQQLEQAPPPAAPQQRAEAPAACAAVVVVDGTHTGPVADASAQLPPPPVQHPAMAEPTAAGLTTAGAVTRANGASSPVRSTAAGLAAGAGPSSDALLGVAPLSDPHLFLPSRMAGAAAASMSSMPLVPSTTSTTAPVSRGPPAMPAAQQQPVSAKGAATQQGMGPPAEAAAANHHAHPAGIAAARQLLFPRHLQQQQQQQQLQPHVLLPQHAATTTYCLNPTVAPAAATASNAAAAGAAAATASALLEARLSPAPSGSAAAAVSAPDCAAPPSPDTAGALVAVSAAVAAFDRRPTASTSQLPDSSRPFGTLGGGAAAAAAYYTGAAPPTATTANVLRYNHPMILPAGRSSASMLGGCNGYGGSSSRCCDNDSNGNSGGGGAAAAAAAAHVLMGAMFTQELASPAGVPQHKGRAPVVPGALQRQHTDGEGAAETEAAAAGSEPLLRLPHVRAPTADLALYERHASLLASTPTLQQQQQAAGWGSAALADYDTASSSNSQLPRELVMLLHSVSNLSGGPADVAGGGGSSAGGGGASAIAPAAAAAGFAFKSSGEEVQATEDGVHSHFEVRTSAAGDCTAPVGWPGSHTGASSGGGSGGGLTATAAALTEAAAAAAVAASKRSAPHEGVHSRCSDDHIVALAFSSLGGSSGRSGSHTPVLGGGALQQRPGSFVAPRAGGTVWTRQGSHVSRFARASDKSGSAARAISFRSPLGQGEDATAAAPVGAAATTAIDVGLGASMNPPAEVDMAQALLQQALPGMGCIPMDKGTQRVAAGDAADAAEDRPRSRDTRQASLLSTGGVEVTVAAMLQHDSDQSKLAATQDGTEDDGPRSLTQVDDAAPASAAFATAVSAAPGATARATATADNTSDPRRWSLKYTKLKASAAAAALARAGARRSEVAIAVPGAAGGEASAAGKSLMPPAARSSEANAVRKSAPQLLPAASSSAATAGGGGGGGGSAPRQVAGTAVAAAQDAYGAGTRRAMQPPGLLRRLAGLLGCGGGSNTAAPATEKD